MQNKIQYIFNNKYIRHIAFWIVIYMYYNVLNLLDRSYDHVIDNSIYLLIDVIGVYFTLYVLLPRYILKKKFFLFVLFFFIQVICLLGIGMFLKYIVVAGWLGHTIKRMNLLDQFFYSSYTIILIIGAATALKLARIWYFQEREKAEIAQKQVDAELKLLKSQVNPHFLFNTLNNINSLVFIDQQKTYDAIIRLSELLRYMISQAEKQKVFLRDELEYLKSYIELQRIRFRNNDFISFNVVGEASGKMVAPMLFIPFIENAFKHGSKNSQLNPGIDIQIQISKLEINFSCINYIRVEKKDSKDDNGIGIENARRRLELIYPDKHRLEITEKEDTFIVELIVEFES